MISKTKTFDSVKWVRELRDKNYDDNKDLSMAEFAFKLSRNARKSELWRLFAKNRKINKK